MNRAETRRETDQHESVARASDALRVMLGGKSRRGAGALAGHDVSEGAGRRSTSGCERSQSQPRGTLAVKTALRSSPTGLAAMMHGDGHPSVHTQHDSDTHSPRHSLGYRASNAGLPDPNPAPSPHTLTSRLLSSLSNSNSYCRGYSSTDGRMDLPPLGSLTATTSSLSRTLSSRMPGLSLTIPPSPGAQPHAPGSQHHSPHPPADPRDGGISDNDPNELYDSPCSSPHGSSRSGAATAFRRAHSRLHPSTPCTPPGSGTNPTLASIPPSAAATPPLLYSSTSGPAPCSPRAMTPTPPGYDRAPAPTRLMSSRRFASCAPGPGPASAGSPRSSFCGLGGAPSSSQGPADKAPPHGPAAPGSETQDEVRLRPSQCGSVATGCSSPHGHVHDVLAHSRSGLEASPRRGLSRASSFSLMLQQQQQQSATSGPYSSCPSALPPARMSMGGGSGLSMQHHGNSAHPHPHAQVYIVAHIHSLTHAGGSTNGSNPKLRRGGSLCEGALRPSESGSGSARQSLSGLPSSHHGSHSRNHHTSHVGADGYGGSYDRPSLNSPRATPRSTDDDASGNGGGHGGSANAIGSGGGNGDMRLVSSNSRRFSRGRAGVLGDLGAGNLLGSVAKQLADLNEETEGAAQRLRERNYRRIAESKAVIVKPEM